MWGDETMLYVADGGDGIVYVYNPATKALERTINTLDAAGNDDPFGLWSDGVLLCVSEQEDRKIYAYHLATGARVTELEFSPSALGDPPQPGAAGHLVQRYDYVGIGKLGGRRDTRCRHAGVAEDALGQRDT